MAIHFIGRRTFDSCRKYFRLVHILSETKISHFDYTISSYPIYSEYNLLSVTIKDLINSHAVSCCKVSMHEITVMQDKPCLQISVDTLTVAASEQMRLVQYHCSQPL